MDTLNFNFVFLGQSVLKYEVPLDVYSILNHVYETKRHELPRANPQLVGKIQNEHSLFFGCRRIDFTIKIPECCSSGPNTAPMIPQNSSKMTQYCAKIAPR